MYVVSVLLEKQFLKISRFRRLAVQQCTTGEHFKLQMSFSNLELLLHLEEVNWISYIKRWLTLISQKQKMLPLKAFYV